MPAQAVLAVASAGGCASFDTAPHDGNGLSEQRIGQALRAVPRDGFFLSSKVGRLLQPDALAPRDQHGYVQVLPFRQRWDYSAAGTRRSVEDSLQRLGLACRMWRASMGRRREAILEELRGVEPRFSG